MKRTYSIFIATILIFCIIFSGCGKSASDSADSSGQASLVVSVGASITEGNYDPCKGYGIYGYGIFHTALLTFSDDLTTDYDVAEDYTISDDRLTYIFTIRDDIQFSDGTFLTPQDVVFTYLTAKSSGSSVDLTMLETAEVTGEQEVTFTLNKVYTPFIRTAALLGIVPEHAYDDDYSTNPIGTGPYKVKQLDMEQQLIVVPNEYYYGTPSSFEQVTFLNLEEETALAKAMSGQLDVVMIHPEFAGEEVPEMELKTFQTADNRGFNLPCIPETMNAEGEIVGNNVTSDYAVRKALQIGIDREEIINNALNGIGTSSWVRFEGLPWANMEPGLEDGQTEAACTLLDEAGWTDSDGDGIREKDGVKCAFTITARTDDLQRYNLALALSENAAKLGVEITAKAEDWASCKESVRHLPTCIGTGDYNFVDVYYAFSSDFYHLDGVDLNNTALYKNDTVDSYLDLAMAAESEEEAISYLKLAQYDGTEGVNIDYPYLWIVTIDHTYFVKEGLDLGNQRIHPHGHGEPVIQNLNEWKFT